MSMVLTASLGHIRRRIAAAGPGRDVRLVAVSKLKPADAVIALADQGQRHFGENYVQEGVAKIAAAGRADLVWHLIGPLQSNKCALAARHFDWVETIDRIKLLPLLANARPPERGALNVLVQVNVDAEATKAGAAPDDALALCDAVAGYPALALRGLMAIPDPAASPQARARSFATMRALFETAVRRYSPIDTLSMGMSDDFEEAIRAGATEVRIGSLLFGPRSP